jgi:hypothetical protein
MVNGEWYENGPGGFLDVVILTSYLELVIIWSSSFAHLMTGAGFPRALHRNWTLSPTLANTLPSSATTVGASRYCPTITPVSVTSWGQHYKILTPKDSPTTAHCIRILNLRYRNALTQFGAQRAMLRIKMYSSIHTYTHTHILNLSTWCGERLTSSWLLHPHSQCLWYPYNRRLGVLQNMCECFWAEENLFSTRKWVLILQSRSF